MALSGSILTVSFDKDHSRAPTAMQARLNALRAPGGDHMRPGGAPRSWARSADGSMAPESLSGGRGRKSARANPHPCEAAPRFGFLRSGQGGVRKAVWGPGLD